MIVHIQYNTKVKAQGLGEFLVHNIRDDVRKILNVKTRNPVDDETLQYKSATEQTHGYVKNPINEESQLNKAVTYTTPGASTTGPSPLPSDVRSTDTSGSNKTTEFDGRENFAGGCIQGYSKSAEGRCKPSV